MKTLTKLTMTVAVLFFATACDAKKEGPIEKAGKKVDNAVDNIKDGESPLHKQGAAEKAGEAIDDAVGSNKH